MQGRAEEGEREGGEVSIPTLEMGNPGPDKSTDFPWVTQSQKQT